MQPDAASTEEQKTDGPNLVSVADDEPSTDKQKHGVNISLFDGASPESNPVIASPNGVISLGSHNLDLSRI